MIPLTHNIYVMSGEKIGLTLGYDAEVSAEDLFACIRLKPDSADYLQEFLIIVDQDNLEEGDVVTITMQADGLPAGTYWYDLYCYDGESPYECFLRGRIICRPGVSDRGRIK